MADTALPPLLSLPTELLFQIAAEAYNNQTRPIVILPSGRLLPQGLLHVCRKLRHDLWDHVNECTPVRAHSLDAYVKNLDLDSVKDLHLRIQSELRSCRPAGAQWPVFSVHFYIDRDWKSSAEQHKITKAFHDFKKANGEQWTHALLSAHSEVDLTEVCTWLENQAKILKLWHEPMLQAAMEEVRRRNGGPTETWLRETNEKVEWLAGDAMAVR